MFKLKRDYKIPYINRVIPAKTLVFVLGGFTNSTDMDKVKIEVKKLGKTETERATAKIGDVYAIKEELLETNY